jgi:subtilisin family serine protease
MARRRAARPAARAQRPRLEPLEGRSLLASAVSWQAAAAAPAPPVAQTLLVRFADNLSAAQVNGVVGRLRGQVVQSFPDGPAAVVFKSPAARDAALGQLSAKPWVVYAEANSPLQSQAQILPNDPSFQQLWGLNSGNDVDIDAPEAWAQLGSAAAAGAGVLVAVLDTGIDLTHVDLQGRIYVNTGEIPGNGYDDDRNGYIDDYNGWNFVARTGDVTDDNGHGTHVSGTIAAASNGTGVVGVAPGATILPLKILDADGGGTTLDAVNAIYFAAARGARVINASWGGPGYSQSMADAIRSVGQPAGSATGKGVVFVTAAGNDGTNNDNRASYPANNRFGTTLSVAAVDSSGRLASYSNTGARTVDLAAPGSSIVSTVPGGYASYSGTSMASPHVAGIVALAAAQNPGETAAQLVSRVVTRTKPLASTSGRTITGGLASASRVLDPSQPPSQGGGGGGSNSGGGSSSPSSGTASPSAPSPNPAPAPAPAVVDADYTRALILGSDEYFARAGGNNRAFVDAIYRAILGRPAEISGLDFWTARLAVTARVDVVHQIMKAPEAYRTKVARWYAEDLGRPGTLDQLKADGGVSYWTNLLASGVPDTQVRAAILGSGEYIARSGGSNESFLAAAYPATLGRSGSAAELANAVVWLQSGVAPSSLVSALLSSGEGHRALVARWYQTDLGRTASLASLKGDSGVAFWAGLIAV